MTLFPLVPFVLFWLFLRSGCYFVWFFVVCCSFFVFDACEVAGLLCCVRAFVCGRFAVGVKAFGCWLLLFASGLFVLMLLLLFVVAAAAAVVVVVGDDIDVIYIER